MPRQATPEWGDEEGLAREIAAAVPQDDLEDALALSDFLVSMGLPKRSVRVADFELEAFVGRGGFGSVYLAIQPGLDRRVALKVFHQDRQISAAWLRREAQALAQLNHPNVVQIYQVAESPRGMFIAMEYIDGQHLRTWQTDKSWHDVLEAYAQAGDGLAAAHARGILHLDFKPSNALMGRDGRVRVVDFGLSGGPGLQATGGSGAHERSSARVHTRAVGGTHGYASPEQEGRGTVGPASDQYSFCAALYEALHGALPFGYGTPRPARSARVPRWIDALLRRGLARSERDRWPSMAALLQALRRPPWYRRVREFAVLGATLVMMPVLAAAAFQHADDPCVGSAEDLGLDWNADRRRDVQRAIEGRESPYGDVLAQTVGDELSRWSDAWAASTRTVCHAARSGATTTDVHVGQRECLGRQSDRFESVVGMITSGSTESIERADALVAELELPTACEVTGPVSQPASPADPREPELLTQLDRTRLDVAAGRVAEAAERAAHTLALADDIGTPAVRAEAFLVRGMVRDAAGEDDDALHDLDEAAALATEIGRDELVAESWRRATRIAAQDLEDLARAGRCARLGAATVRRLGEPPRLLAEQLDAEGLLARLEGDAATAESRHRAALVHLEQVLTPDDPRWIDTWLLLAHALRSQGDAARAGELYDDALELAQRRLGPAHPELARIQLARALAVRDDTAASPEAIRAALDDLGGAVELLERELGPDSIRLAPTLTVRSQLGLQLGLLDEAEALALRARQLHVAHLPAGHSERTGALTELAGIAAARGELRDALRHYEALAIESAGSSDANTLAGIHNNIGWLRCRVGRCEDAGADYQRVLDTGDAAMRAFGEAGLGWVARSAGHLDEARTRLEAALVLARTLDEGPPADLVAETQWHLAEVRLALGEPEARVLPLVDEALAYYRDSGSDQFALDAVIELRRRCTTP
jgi:eukaryotic-like serine/threonine-protein kinase